MMFEKHDHLFQVRLLCVKILLLVKIILQDQMDLNGSTHPSHGKDSIFGHRDLNNNSNNRNK